MDSAASAQAEEGSSTRRWLLPMALLVGLLLAWVGYGAWLGTAIARGTSVEGVAVGGLQPPQARSVLSASLAERRGPVTISATAEGSTHTATIALLTNGASIDLDATVAALPRRQWNPLWMISHLINGRAHHAVVTIDTEALGDGLANLAQTVTTPPVEGDITFSGATPVAVDPRPGTALDLDTLAAEISAQWLSGVRDFAVAVIPADPTVSAAEVERALAEVARPAVSGPVTLHVDGNPIRVTPSAIAAALHFHPDESGRLRPHLVAEEFTTALGSQWQQWTVPARNASFRTVNGTVQVVPSIKGRDVPADRLEEAMLAAISKSGVDRVAYVATVDVDPPLTTDAAINLDLRERIGYFQTQFPWTSYRAHNIHRAADILNGTIIQPDEVFSLNGTLGRRTAANGFVEGVVISGGRLAKDFGGGVSQVATTTWNAAWFAGLELLQHKPHSFYISRYPVGRESTVSWPNVDVKFRNDTGKPILITTSYYSNYISISIYGNRKYEVETITGPRTNPTSVKSYEDDSPTCINQDGVAGFTIEVTRILKQDGVEVSRKTYRTRYLSEDRVRCTNPEATFGNAPTPTKTTKPKPKPTPTATATATPDPTPAP